MRKLMNLYSNCFLMGLITFLVSCDNVKRAPINRRLLEAQIQGKVIRSKLIYYRLDKKIFPRKLTELNIGWNEDKKAINDSSIEWIYHQLDGGRGCILRTRAKIDGYFVFLDQNGNIDSSKIVPTNVIGK